MEMQFKDKFSKTKRIDLSETMPVPRVGERVWMGYLPAPTVIDVAYDYERRLILITLE